MCVYVHVSFCTYFYCVVCICICEFVCPYIYMCVTVYVSVCAGLYSFFHLCTWGCMHCMWITLDAQSKDMHVCNKHGVLITAHTFVIKVLSTIIVFMIVTCVCGCRCAWVVCKCGCIAKCPCMCAQDAPGFVCGF